MKRLVIAGLLAMLYVTNSVAQDAWKLETKDFGSKIKLEVVVSGYLADINGKYKLRISEATFQPGGYVGDHQHSGPGMRYIAAGELTVVEAGKTTTYKAGESFYESGSVTNKAQNNGKVPTVLITTEILPVDWKGGTAIQPKAKK
ncbi:MAG: cupin domain-containing protein [Burkholderiales bacterium]